MYCWINRPGAKKNSGPFYKWLNANPFPVYFVSSHCSVRLRGWKRNTHCYWE